MVQHRLPMLPSAGEASWVASINGIKKQLNIENNAILLDVLRDKAGSLGTKRGCDMGTCGCCSVLINGEPRLSCLTLAAEAEGCDITTVEGLADGHHLHPIQEMFAECGGSQCGFCTPGMIMAAIDIINRKPILDEKIVREELEGNLCRCTGYQNIVKSILAAANK